MNFIVLSNEEILRIKSFIQDASDIPVVECVYLLPYYSQEEKKEKIDVITIWNESSYYNSLLTGEGEMRDSEEERVALEDIIQKYQHEAEDGRLTFLADDSWNYSLSLMSNREQKSEMSLANGTILFDRFDEKKGEKVRAMDYFAKEESVLEVANMSQLMESLQESRRLG